MFLSCFENLHTRPFRFKRIQRNEEKFSDTLLAEENDAELVLLNVMPQSDMKHHAVALAHLYDLVPSDSRMQCQPFAVVRYGEAADCILETAAERSADVIVLGVRGAAKHLGAATHLERATAHKVVSHTRCPVLTVRA